MFGKIVSSLKSDNFWFWFLLILTITVLTIFEKKEDNLNYFFMAIPYIICLVAFVYSFVAIESMVYTHIVYKENHFKILPFVVLVFALSFSIFVPYYMKNIASCYLYYLSDATCGPPPETLIKTYFPLLPIYGFIIGSFFALPTIWFGGAARVLSTKMLDKNLLKKAEKKLEQLRNGKFKDKLEEKTASFLIPIDGKIKQEFHLAKLIRNKRYEEAIALQLYKENHQIYS
ncbi:MAG: hypothetical protein L3J52_03980 [Proteobacteria bacterium]|nr:hypothetical protein [Pseudomonadota bacterium]